MKKKKLFLSLPMFLGSVLLASACTDNDQNTNNPNTSVNSDPKVDKNSSTTDQTQNDVKQMRENPTKSHSSDSGSSSPVSKPEVTKQENAGNDKSSTRLMPMNPAKEDVAHNKGTMAESHFSSSEGDKAGQGTPNPSSEHMGAAGTNGAAARHGSTNTETSPSPQQPHQHQAQPPATSQPMSPAGSEGAESSEHTTSSPSTSPEQPTGKTPQSPPHEPSQPQPPSK